HGCAVLSGPQDEMEVARAEAIRDPSAVAFEHCRLRSDRPATRERPFVEVERLAGTSRSLAAVVAEVRLRGCELVPVGRRLDAVALDGHELAVDAEQTLDRALRFLVPAFTEMVVADRAVPVDEVDGGPVVVRKGMPDRVVGVEGHRVRDVHLFDGP